MTKSIWKKTLPCILSFFYSKLFSVCLVHLVHWSLLLQFETHLGIYEHDWPCPTKTILSIFWFSIPMHKITKILWFLEILLNKFHWSWASRGVTQEQEIYQLWSLLILSQLLLIFFFFFLKKFRKTKIFSNEVSLSVCNTPVSLYFMQNSKFDWMPDNIKTEKVILAPIWAC